MGRPVNGRPFILPEVREDETQDIKALINPKCFCCIGRSSAISAAGG